MATVVTYTLMGAVSLRVTLCTPLRTHHSLQRRREGGREGWREGGMKGRKEDKERKTDIKRKMKSSFFTRVQIVNVMWMRH